MTDSSQRCIESTLKFSTALKVTRFADNSITTARYNLLTFVPRALLEQFRRLANVYFLIISVLMILGTYTTWFDSPITPWSTLGTLIVVVAVAMTKEGLEDWKRHRADRATNSQATHKFTYLLENSIRNPQLLTTIDAESRPPQLVDIDWKSVNVGDFVKIFNNENIPADVILVGSSEPFGNAYVETSNIDGETNLKLKNSVLDSRNNPIWAEPAFQQGLTTCKCDTPNASILRFRGTIVTEREEINVDEKSLLLRGCKLKNTAWAVGFVVYTGKESKIVMNSRATPSKLSLLEKTMNSLVFLVFILQLALSLVSFISYLVWIYSFRDNIPYLCVESSSSKNELLASLCESATQYSNAGYLVTFFILYNNFIPISLYVTIEVCNYLQAFFIDSDKNLYDEETDSPAMARTSNMNSDLGMVQYIFSDKTGTLTENIMKFQKLSFGGSIFSVSPVGNENSIRDLQKNAFTAADDFLGYVLSVCHTVVVDDATKELKAESPDEEALLVAANEMGWRFHGRSPDKVIAYRNDARVEFQLLATIPFSSARKRMSVVIRDAKNRLFVLCKGADNVMFDLSTQNQGSHNSRVTLEKDLQKFAFEGLRTLVLGYRELSEEVYVQFKTLWDNAAISEDRDSLRATAATVVETSLTILGATAIEDKLQRGVPETIEFILKSGIKLWVLTGDKTETAINIGYSARLITRDMIVIRMEYGNDHATVKRKLQLLVNRLRALLPEKTVQKMTPNAVSFSWDFGFFGGKQSSIPAIFESSDFDEEESLPLIDNNTQLSGLTSDRLALVVDGSSLLSIIGDKECERMFLSVAGACKTVIACRVSPEQKRLLVRLVKNHAAEKPLTLSIGDGANDVPMIQEAAIGVGVSGREGRQAVNNADFAIAQFRFLKRLLFVHGRWNYKRTSKVVLYSFYKNIVLALSMFFYTFFSGYSGQTMYESNIYGLYNIVLSLPVIAFGIFDRDETSLSLLAKPHLYAPGRNRTDLNWAAIFIEFVQAIFDSCILFFIPYATYYSSMDIVQSHGRQSGIWQYGFVVYSIILIAMMIRIMLVSCTWTWIWHLFSLGSMLAFVAFALIYQLFYDYSYDFYGVANKTFSSEYFWIVAFVSCFLSASIKISWDLVVEIFAKNSGAIVEKYIEETKSTSKQPSWASLDQWGDSISESERQVLGLMNTSKDRMSSYNFDHVTTTLGPGASIHRFFEDAKKSFANVFSYSATQRNHT